MATHHDEPLLAPESAQASSAAWTWIVALSCAVSYAFTYFWRYPAFMLPPEILEQRVLGALDLQACFSLAFIVGFGAAKPPATSFASSPFFFRHRLRVLLLLLTASMLIEGIGLLASTPAVQVLAVFVSSFFSSFIYGLELTYLEGRRATELCLAIVTLCLVYAGNASRTACSGPIRRLRALLL
jgi:sugar phosphate permease